MQWIAVATPPFGSIEQFDTVMAQVGGEPEGLEARYVGTAGDGLRVVTLWESKAHADRFFAERLGPAWPRHSARSRSGRPRSPASTWPVATSASRSAESGSAPADDGAA
ncbi:MAG: hypothetical protein M3O23_09955, partial [Actinomycetota bacterium]|nr:hypothetical protein [Actinomycetota bacterium]